MHDLAIPEADPSGFGSGPGERRARLLIVDDELDGREALALLLGQRGYETLEAPGGGGARTILGRDENIDLILLDLNLGDTDGYELLRWLRSGEKTRGVPVICVTGRSAVDDTVEGLKLGAVDYVSKPFEPKELLARIAGALRIKRSLDQLSRGKRAAEQLSLTDPLTGLPNRRDLEHRLEEELDRARRQLQDLACLMIDIDSFKAINDRFGHAAGDAVLIQVARALRAAVRSFDVVARYGGDEFVVLLPGADAEGASRAAAAIHDVLLASQLSTVDAGGLVLPTLSIGIASSVRGVREPAAQLLERADSALLSAKRAGRNRSERSPVPPSTT